MTRLHKRQYFPLRCIPFFHLPSASLPREAAKSDLLPGGIVVYARGEAHDEGNI